MLILSRKADEAIVIGDEVTITILSVKGKQVRLGISAPDNVSVHREEIYARLQDEDAGNDRTGGHEDNLGDELGDEAPDDNIGNR